MDQGDSVKQPPEPPEFRTDRQILTDAITTACTDLRRDWPHMIRDGETQPVGAAPTTGVLLDDHDPRDADQRRIDKTISLRRLAQDQLNGWCRVIIEDRPVTNNATVPSGVDVPGMVTFLATHADWISGHEAATDCRDEVRDLARRCHAVVHPQRKEWISLGSCPLEVEFDPEVGVQVCRGEVRAWPRADDRDGETMARCRRCGTEAVPNWWESQMFKDEDLKVLLTAEEVVTFVHRAYGKVIKPSTVRQWDKRHVIEPAGFNDDGRRLYHRDALVWALDLKDKRERVGG
jgi:hypothetical protein